jgi:hypothetical protein
MENLKKSQMSTLKTILNLCEVLEKSLLRKADPKYPPQEPNVWDSKYSNNQQQYRNDMQQHKGDVKAHQAHLNSQNTFPKGSFEIKGDRYDPEDENLTHLSHHAAFKLAQKHGLSIDDYNADKHIFTNPHSDHVDNQVDLSKLMGWLGY